MGSDDYIARLPWLLVQGALIWKLILLVFVVVGLRYGLRWRTRMILKRAPCRSLETAAL